MKIGLFDLVAKRWRRVMGCLRTMSFAIFVCVTISAKAQGVPCTRSQEIGFCTSMEYFTTPVWGPGGDWTLWDPPPPNTIAPTFSSSTAEIQAQVASNPNLNVCGTTPQVTGPFTYFIFEDKCGLFTNWFSFTDPGDAHNLACATIPDENLRRAEVEEGFLPTYWLIPTPPNGPIVDCSFNWPIWPERRRIAVCPAGFSATKSLSDGSFWGNSGVELFSTEILQQPNICFRPIKFDPKMLGACTPNCPTAGNPVNIATGNKYQRELDIQSTQYGSLEFERHYNSQPMGAITLGPNWRHNYDRRITFEGRSTPSYLWVSRPDGKGYQFHKPTNGTQWTSDADVADRLYANLDSGGNIVGWQYITTNDDTETFGADGKLTSITNRAGLAQTLQYSVAGTPGYASPGLLMQVTDSYGRQLTFHYDDQSRISQVVDALGQSYIYSYDASGQLETVTYPDAHQRSYLYNESAFTQGTDEPWALTGIIDENGSRYATFSYDSSGKAIASEHAGGTEHYQLSYQSGVSFSFTNTVTDPLGTSRNYAFSTVNAVFKNTGLSQACVACGLTSKEKFYDGNGNLSSQTDFNFFKTIYQYDLTRNLETLRSEADGWPIQRRIFTQWHPAFRLPAQITEPAPGGTKTTTFTYDGFGNLTQKSIVAPRNDGSGTNLTRTWNWTYATLGRVLTATDPDNHPTTYTYYGDNDPDLGKRGNVQTITNAAGHVTQITGYDANGHPLSITDLNGLITTLTYDPRGRPTARQVGVETTSYTYDGVGQLIKVTSPDKSYLQYTYDAAHRLIDINDGLGNKIVYTLDAMGNRLTENTFDPAGTLTRTRSRNFDSLNRLAADLGALNQTTGYTYDNDDVLLTTTDPLNHSTGYIYDGLRRLTQALDPNGGVTSYAYDDANNLAQVTDARGSVTAYSYDGLNDLVTLVSPDTGTTVDTYDAAGNLLTKTDARGAVATYTYESLNRATQVVYSKTGNPNETHTFSYDSGANAKGRLTQVIDPAATTSWTYNGQGRVASKAQLVAGISKTLTYGYNTAGQLTSVTTPSGQQIGYGYVNNRVASITVNGQSLLANAETTPFGPLGAWQWGNSLAEFRDYDTDGRLATWEFRDGASILRKDQSFDLASRITGIADPDNPSSSQTYQYDVLDRLTVAQTGSPTTHTQQFTYDSVGNRLNATIDSAVTNLSYAAGDNKLQAMTGMVDANYLNGATALTFAYNNANRLVLVQSSGATIATYAINALGQRVSKTTGGVTTTFVYDEQGHLIGEYDGSGTLIQETVLLEDLPVATLRPTGAGGNPTSINTYYVHADHLGSARAVTRPSDNKLLWQWDNLDPFGGNVANENPAGQGLFHYNLRFPGQYYDAETGLAYNYYRDYDPSIGRYEQSDPIGLDGGINTYAYATSTPLAAIDPKALAIWICSRSARGMPGNHTYVWDDRGSGRSCGMEQFFGHGDDPFKPEKGPGGGDSCRKVPGSDGVENDVMNCCRDSNKSGGWLPFVNDCLTVANRCIDRFLPGANPGAPGDRFGKCPSCATK